MDLKCKRLTVFVVLFFIVSFAIYGDQISNPGLDKTLEKSKTDKNIQANKTQIAVDKGLEFLASRQNSDGSWMFEGPPSKELYYPAATAIVLTAFIQNENGYNYGKYKKAVKKGFDYLLDSAFDSESGLFNDKRSKDSSTLYAHAYILIALEKVFKKIPKNKNASEKIKIVVEKIIKSQNKTGGFPYQVLPKNSGSQSTCTAALLEALQASRNMGAMVPQEVIDKAANYIKNIQNEDGNFAYIGKSNRRILSDFGRTGACLTGLMASGVPSEKEIKKGMGFIKKHKGFTIEELFQCPYYGIYYTCKAVYHAEKGKYWNEWHPRIRDMLITRQEKDGSFTLDRSDHTFGAIFRTAFSIMALSVDKDQRREWLVYDKYGK